MSLTFSAWCLVTYSGAWILLVRPPTIITVDWLIGTAVCQSRAPSSNCFCLTQLNSSKSIKSIESNRIGSKSNRIESNRIESNQIKSNQIKSNQIKSNLSWLHALTCVIWWSFVIFTLWCARTQSLHRNSSQSTHLELATAFSSQLLQYCNNNRIRRGISARKNWKKAFYKQQFSFSTWI